MGLRWIWQETKCLKTGRSQLGEKMVKLESQSQIERPVLSIIFLRTTQDFLKMKAVKMMAATVPTQTTATTTMMWLSDTLKQLRSTQRKLLKRQHVSGQLWVAQEK